MSRKEKLAHLWHVNKDNQIEAVDLIRDKKNPDGVLSVTRLQEMSPRTPGTHRPFGRTKRLPDEQALVRIQPTGEIIQEEATLEATNTVIEMWDKYGPLK